MRPGEGYVIFAEDVRRECDDRHSLVGVFHDDIIFTKPFPRTMPHLGIVAHVYIDARSRPQSLAISLDATWLDEPHLLMAFDEELLDELAEFSDSYAKKYGKDPLSRFDGVPRTVVVAAVLPLFEIPEAGMLRVISTLDGEDYLLGRKLVLSGAEVDVDEDDNRIGDTEEP